MTMDITPQPLTRDAFAPFGDVIDVPDRAGRAYYEDTLGNLRPGAHSSLSVSLKAETPYRPLQAKMLERHEFSSQTFVPIDVQRWLVVMAPHAAAGGPDLGGVRAFVATGKQGVTSKAQHLAPRPHGTGPARPLRGLQVARWHQGRRGVRSGEAFHDSHSLTAEARP